MDLFAHGDTIPMIFYIVYGVYYDISNPHEFFTYLLRFFIKLGEIFMVLFMIWKLHIMQILLNLLMLFGKEFADIYFPWLIMLLYQIILESKYILMIPLHHQIMTIKGPLHMIFVYNTLMH